MAYKIKNKKSKEHEYKWVGKLVWYKDEVYQVVKKGKNGRYTLENKTMKKMVENVSPAQWSIY